jgi:nucleotide-binding universal stress UspA family protein
MGSKLKRVLIALDYDPTAQKVAEDGFSLAKAMGAKATLLHIIADPVYYSALDHVTIMGFAGYQNITPFQNDTIGVLINESREFLRKSKQHLGDDSIDTVVKEGDIADSILSTAKDLKSDIIVMGSHSRKWLEKIIMGSVAEKVLNNSTIPLFIIPTKKTN